jgi:hypothetical protein
MLKKNLLFDKNIISTFTKLAETNLPEVMVSHLVAEWTI